MTAARLTRKVVGLPSLAAQDVDAWQRLHESVPHYDSPFFHPAFAQALQATGTDVSVVVATGVDRDVTVLLPFHRRGKRMQPMGWPGSDFQGPLLAPGASIDPRDLIPAGLKSFEFDHLLEVCDGFRPWIHGSRASPYVDVGGGLDGYLELASKSGRQNMSQARRRTAKADRELGGVRFEAEVVDDGLLDRVVELKRAQYKATGVRDYFGDLRRIALLRRLLHTRTASFGGVLSAVFAGDRLLAAHFGLRAGPVLHWWFPVYDPAFARYGPGWILLRELVGAAPSMGIERIDLGRGDDDYKRWAKTGQTVVCEGYVSISPTRLAVRRTKARSIQAAKSSPLAPKMRQAVHSWRERGA